MSNPPPPLDYSATPPRDPIWPITFAGFGTLLLVGIVLSTLLVSAGNKPNPADLPPGQTIVIGFASTIATIAVLLCGDATLRPGSLTRIGFEPRAALRGFFIGVAAAAIIVPIVFGASYLTECIWNALHYSHESAHPLLRLFGEGTDGLRIGIVVLATVFAPVGEEMLFRAHLQSAFSNSVKLPGIGRPIFAVGVTSLIFALFHGELWMMPPLFVLSLGMGAMFQWTGNIFTSIAIHVCFNSVSVLYYWLAR